MEQLLGRLERNIITKTGKKGNSKIIEMLKFYFAKAQLYTIEETCSKLKIGKSRFKEAGCTNTEIYNL